MKRIVLTLLLACMLLTTAACGGGMSGDEKARTNNPRIGDVETPGARSGESTLRKGEQDVRRGANNAMEDVKETLDGSSWDEMVRNGKVRDRDGDLKDGENALHGRYGATR